MRVLACATTGIAAELLIEGSTVHRRFGVPNNLQIDDPVRIARHSAFAMVLDSAQVIIIDEISMHDRAVLEYIERTLRAISAEFGDLPFAGKVVVLGGDWKQLMPVIPGAGSEKQYLHSVKNSPLFRW